MKTQIAGHKLKIVLLVIAVLITAALLVRRSGQPHESRGPDDSHYLSFGVVAHDRELRNERARVYQEAAKEAEDFNGRPLTGDEKEELWQLSRTDAARNLRQRPDDPTLEPDR